MNTEVEIIQSVLASPEALNIVLCVSNIIAYKAWLSERKERREGWKAFNSFTKETNSLYLKMAVTLEGIKHEIIQNKKDR